MTAKKANPQRPKRWSDYNDEQKRLHTEAMRAKNPNYLNPDEVKTKKRPTGTDIKLVDLANRKRTGKICGAKRSDGGVCCQPAGRGTLHLGEGACHLHGGSVQNHLIKAVREEAIKKSIMYGAPIDISPDVAVLQELNRTAGHIAWLHQQIQDINTPNDLFKVTAVGVTQDPFLALYRQEREHLVKVAKAAKDMGIAERQIQLAENQGKMLAMVLANFMNDPDLALTPTQRLSGREIARKHLLAIDVTSVEAVEAI